MTLLDHAIFLAWREDVVHYMVCSLLAQSVMQCDSVTVLASY